MQEDILNWENKFIELFNQNNADFSTVHFEYLEHTKIVKVSEFGGNRQVFNLKVSTFNPIKQQAFLLIETNANSVDKLHAIQLAYSELVNMRQNAGYNSYTIEWSKKGESMKHSYFYAKNPIEALTKFYSSSNAADLCFYSLKINPIS
jgi:hypothetical protein